MYEPPKVYSPETRKKSPKFFVLKGNTRVESCAKGLEAVLICRD